MSKDKFVRSKPNVNIGALGDLGHGKTTLMAAITKNQAAKGLARYHDYDELDAAPQRRERGVTFSMAAVEYDTEARCYAHVDCPAHGDCVKNLILGAERMDGAILVVSAPDGLTRKTEEQVRLALQVGVPAIVVYLNRVDESGEVDGLEGDVRALLSRYGLSGDTTPIIRGSALQALEGEATDLGTGSIRRLLDACDAFIPQPKPAVDLPFFMPVEDRSTSRDGATVAAGRVERGVVKVGDEVELVGASPTVKTVVTGVEMFRKRIDAAQAGDAVGVLLRDLKLKDVEPGQVLCKPGAIDPHTKFTAEVDVLMKEEGGRHTPFFDGYRPQFWFRTADVTGAITLPPGCSVIAPGEHMSVDIELIRPIACEVGLRFAIREGGRTVGQGVVTKILE